MEKGENSYLNRIFKYIDEEDKGNIVSYVNEGLNQNYETFESSDNLNQIMNENSNLSEEESEAIRLYTGNIFESVNNAKRDKWDYSYDGNESLHEERKELGDRISSIIENNPCSASNFITFRGSDLNYFKDYGIESLEDLTSLKNKFFLDRGFVSTSLVEDECFYGKDYGGTLRNIKIKYMIPEGFDDGMYLGNNSYYYGDKNESEYLINSSNLGYITDVKVENNKAELTIMMIPKYVYDKYYRQTKESQEENKVTL